MEGGPPMFGQGFTCPALLEDRTRFYPYGAVTRYGPTFQTVPVLTSRATGLVRVRSPLLTESRLMSFPPGTEMFQFPGFASAAYGFSGGYSLAEVGCPIRRSSDQSLLAAPRGFSQRATSFIASWRQGIHQMPLLSSTPTSDNRTLTPPVCDLAGTAPAHEREGARQPPPEGDSSDNYHYKRWPLRPRARDRARKHTHAKHAPCPQTEEEGQGRIDLPAPAAPRRMAGIASRHARTTGTSSPPHDVQRTHAAARPAGPAARNGALRFGRPGQARATTAAPPPTGKRGLVGLGRLERPTSRLSGVRSNQLSYRPESHPAGPRQRAARAGRTHDLRTRGPRSDGCVRRDVQTAAGDCYPRRSIKTAAWTPPACRVRAPRRRGPREVVQPRRRPQVAADADFMGCLRKEVIQPQVPLRLPCYDFTPVADPTVDACLPCGLAQRLRVEPTPMV